MESNQREPECETTAYYEEYSGEFTGRVDIRNNQIERISISRAGDPPRKTDFGYSLQTIYSPIVMKSAEELDQLYHLIRRVEAKALAHEDKKANC